MHIYIYIYIYIHIYIYIYIYDASRGYAAATPCRSRTQAWRRTSVGRPRLPLCCTANLLTNIMDLRGFDSSTILVLRGGILMSIGDFPESLSQAILVGSMFVGGLGVRCGMPCCTTLCCIALGCAVVHHVLR